MVDGLNPSQVRAVEHHGGHCLVGANPGAGKTRVIIMRVAHLIKMGTPASRIVVITFTRRAAREIVERVKSELGRAAEGLRASTFHAFCMNLLRRYGEMFGTKNSTVIDPDDVQSLFRLVRNSLNDKELPRAADAASVYSYARNVCIPIAAACEAKDIDPDLAPGIIQLCKGYEERKRQRGFLDYDDILGICASAMERDPKIRELVKRPIEHLLIDEFQDTNPLQMRLVTQLKDPVRLFCVGDAKQSIYKFRGADVSNMLEFSERVGGAVTLPLEVNYRSTQGILDLANWLLDQSPLPYETDMRAHRGEGIKPVLREFRSEWDEAEWIADDISSRYLGGGKFSDQMILVRSAYAGRAVERALLAKNIPYVFVGGTALLASAHVRDVLSILRILANYRDDLAWMRLLQLFPRIGEATAEKIANTFVGLDSLEACITHLQTSKSKLPNIADFADRLRTISPLPSEAFATATAMLTPILEAKYRNDNWDSRKRDFAVVSKLAEKHNGDGITAFIEEYVLNPVTSAEVDASSDDDVVTLSTIHSSKGTEAPRCYLPGVNPGAYPHSRSLHDPDEIEEERRVMFVACTRAEDELILTRTVRSFSSDLDAADAYFLAGVPDDYIEFISEVPESFDASFRSSPF